MAAVLLPLSFSLSSPSQSEGEPHRECRQESSTLLRSLPFDRPVALDRESQTIAVPAIAVRHVQTLSNGLQGMRPEALLRQSVRIILLCSRQPRLSLPREYIAFPFSAFW